MYPTKHIAETARRHRPLTRHIAKEAIETCLELLAEKIASGECGLIYMELAKCK